MPPPPPPPPPPSPPPLPTYVRFTAVVEGDVDSFDHDAYKMALAALLPGINLSDISLVVQPASVLVGATIRTESATVATTVASSLLPLYASSDVASAALGVAVTEVRAVKIDAILSPQPPSPATPPSPYLPCVLQFAADEASGEAEEATNAGSGEESSGEEGSGDVLQLDLSRCHPPPPPMQPSTLQNADDVQVNTGSEGATIIAASLSFFVLLVILVAMGWKWLNDRTSRQQAKRGPESVDEPGPVSGCSFFLAQLCSGRPRGSWRDSMDDEDQGLVANPPQLPARFSNGMPPAVSLPMPMHAVRIEPTYDRESYVGEPQLIASPAQPTRKSEKQAKKELRRQATLEGIESQRELKSQPSSADASKKVRARAQKTPSRQCPPPTRQASFIEDEMCTTETF